MKRIATALMTMVACGLSGTPSAMGQNFNIDVSALLGVPAPSYGAAAGRPGVWAVPAIIGTSAPAPLVDVGGGATGVTLTNVSALDEIAFNSPLTGGDDEALLDDLLDFSGVLLHADFVFTGLVPGSYDVYTYNWDPTSPGTVNLVNVNGLLPTYFTGAVWPGGLPGLTYAKATVTITAGQTITVRAFSAGQPHVSGFQLVLIPCESCPTFGFEPPVYSGSSSGTIITGTDGWSLPAVAASTDGRVYAHAGNAPGFPADPIGGSNFAGGIAGANLFPRAQRTINFSAGGAWEVEYDFIGRWVGPALPAVDNIASWSLQDSATARGFQTLLTWGSTAVGPAPNATLNTAAATNYHHAIGYYANATATAAVFATPSNSWRDLLVNNWYHAKIKWDFSTSQVLECTIQDITGGGPAQTTDVSANNWYLRGGPGSTLPLPTAMRIFVGGTGAANTNAAGFDNLKVGPAAVVCYPDCNGSGTLTVADFGCFQTKFVSGDPYADCNGVGGLTIADFACFQTAFVAGCP